MSDGEIQNRSCVQDMKEKDIKLKRLSRRELLEIVVVQSEEIEKLSRELEDMKLRTEKRQSSLMNAGSIAEAALELNGVFDAAQRASDEYISEIRKMKTMQEELYRKAEEEARKRSERLVGITLQKCRAAQEDTIRKCSVMLERAKSEAERYSQRVRDNMNGM